MRIVVHDYAGHPFQFDLSRTLASRGHEVAHVYFSGDQGPKGKVERSDADPDRFSIVPVSIGRPYAKAEFIERRRNDRLYGHAAARAIRDLAPDVVLSGNAPLDAQDMILKASHESGAAFVNWIQDFYGLAIEKLLSHRWLGLGALVAAHYRALETRQFLDSDALILISDSFRPHLPGQLAATPVTVIPNWGALADIPVRPKRNAWSLEHGLAERFVFLYSGTLGMKHNPGLLLALADAFADSPEVCVVVAASGVGRDRLAGELATAPRSNLKLMPLQPFDQFADLLGSSDVVVALLEKDAGEFSVPSKVQSYLCSGRPILLSAPSANLAVSSVVSEGAGEVAEPDDPAAFVAAAKRLYRDPELRLNAGARGRAYAERTFDIERIADRFEEAFASALEARCAHGRSIRLPKLLELAPGA